MRGDPGKGDDPHNAHQAVGRAVAEGQLAPVTTLPCSDCGRVATVYHHYLGYERRHWLAVVALCGSCHTRRHVATRPRAPRPDHPPRTVRLPAALHAALAALAQQHDRSLHGEILAALRAYAAQQAAPATPATR